MKTSAFQRGLLLGAALLVGMPLSAAAKCASRGPDGRILVGQPLVVIDGRQGSQSDIDLLRFDPASMYESVYTMNIVCWNPADSTYNQGGAGVTVTQVLTKPFIERLVADLEKVARAQQSFFAIHGTYSAQLEELGIRDELANGFSIELSVGPAGWSAVAAKGLMAHRCVVKLAEVALPDTPQSSGEIASTEPVAQLGEPACLLLFGSSRKHALDQGLSR